MSTEEEKLLKEAKEFSWEDRLSHKNWKVRNDATIDLGLLCASISDPKDPRLCEFGHFFKKAVSDPFVVVQANALDALLAYLKAADADMGKYSKEICDAVSATCLKGKPQVVKKAQQVFMLWIELEAVDAFLDAMEKAIKNKVAKAVVPAIDVMSYALREFGAKVLPPERLLKMLLELLDHQDQDVRSSSKGLTRELCRWIGKDLIRSILFKKMRDTMKQELEAELPNVQEEAKPTRKFRSEQDKEQVVVTEVPGDCSAKEFTDAPPEIDAYDLVDPVDILRPLDKSGFWVGVKAIRWPERKEGVAELTKLASTKKIAPGDFTEVCKTLKKMVTDRNIAVAIEAIQAIGNLASGLRAHFSSSSHLLLPVLLKKFEEKKPSLANALTQTLQTMYKSGCINLVDIVDVIKTAVKNEVPSVRSLTLMWLTFCIETSNNTVIQKVHEDYAPIFEECLQDGTPEVRHAAFSAWFAIQSPDKKGTSAKLATIEKACTLLLTRRALQRSQQP